jgi:hypothetical protein
MKQANLAAALAEQAGSTRRRTESAPIVTPMLDTTSSTPRTYRQPGRISLVPITAHFPREVRRQLKGLAFELDRTIHDLIAEFLNDGFAKYGKAEIAPRQEG